MQDNLAPIVLFVYNRPEHTLATLEALSKNDLADQSSLFIYCDGPKKGMPVKQFNNLKKVRRVVKTKQWCHQNTIIESNENLGLAKSIIKGVGEIINKFGKAIILEDDLVPAPQFLKFMNDGLNKFENIENVAGISGWSFDIPVKDDAYFSRVGSCWGWATWSRVWDKVNFDAQYWVNYLKDKKLTYDFDVDGSYPFYNMLKQQSSGDVNSWAICFYAGYFVRRDLFLFPKTSLIQNIGEDGSGTHSSNDSQIDVKRIVNNTQISKKAQFKIPTNLKVAECSKTRSDIKRQLRKENSISKSMVVRNLLNKLTNNYSTNHI